MSADRTTLNIMLAALDLEHKDLAKLMGYDRVYVGNVFNGFAQPSDAFKTAFGKVFADLILGASRVEQRHDLPARPLYDYLERRAKTAPSRTQFYSDLGLSVTAGTTAGSSPRSSWPGLLRARHPHLTHLRRPGPRASFLKRLATTTVDPGASAPDPTA